ncbi:YsnF/AvaK domain-containing protein [Sorangium sp. So ce834]|uniref:YsnF/AvaK domain-containing protein n=1 Tax=Sorangium sp. So ce834 TaxID=3133321 RepID=UPI003F6288C2
MNHGERSMSPSQRSQQLSKSQQTAKTATSTAKTDQLRADVLQEQIAVPVMEEELQVGKREVNRGGVRVSSRLVEQPVQESVRLREEHVHVERHPVDRPVQPAALDTFQSGTVELVETDEEAVVAKKARVIEEVVVSKAVTQRTEQIRETLRHTEVHVEPVSAAERSDGARAYEQYDTEFRQHYHAGPYSKHGYAYEQVAPAYLFGYQLGTSQNFRGHDWTTIEAEAGKAWEERNPGTWEHMKSAVRHAWDKVTGKA